MSETVEEVKKAVDDSRKFAKDFSTFMENYALDNKLSMFHVLATLNMVCSRIFYAMPADSIESKSIIIDQFCNEVKEGIALYYLEEKKEIKDFFKDVKKSMEMQ